MDHQMNKDVTPRDQSPRLATQPAQHSRTMSVPFFNAALEEEGTAHRESNVNNGKSIFDLQPFDETDIALNTEKRKADTEVAMSKKRQVDFFDSKTWHKFIGSLIVEATATRPTTKPLVYGSKLSFLVTTLETNAKVKIKRSMGSLIKFWDPVARRELGRLPEKYASMIYPFLSSTNTEQQSNPNKEITFKATIVYSEPKRISVGDSFLVQIDCFINSTLFDNSKKSKHIDPVQLQNTSSLSQSSNFRSQNNIIFGRSSDSDEHEEKLHRRRKALHTLFDELGIKPVVTRETTDPNPNLVLDTVSSSNEDSDDVQEVGHSSVEIINLDDDESEDESEVYRKQYDLQQSTTQPEELSVNQLQNLYKITQSTSSLAELPETVPTGGFQFQLRKYQAQGLSWMLKREHEFDKIQDESFINSNSNKMNPLWKKFDFPTDSSWSSTKMKNTGDETLSKYYNEPMCFYANLYSGDFSLELPTVNLLTKGGILADEMGLGKTISTLSLISTVPTDSKYDSHKVVNKSVENQKPYAYQTTLVVVPMSLLYQWKSEFENSMQGSDKYCEIFYGDQTQKKNLIQHLCANKNPPTLLLTTYGVIQSEFSKYAKNVNGHTGLFSVRFFRLVIDEGHSIRNKQTRTAKAVFEMSSSRKWVLTGTPIINKLDDLYALVKFLDLAPFSEPGFWKTSVSEPFESKKYKAALDVVSTILEPVLLRRTKNMKDANGDCLVELPEKTVTIDYIELSPLERRLYQSFLQVAEKNVRDSLKKGVLLKNYSSILVHILRLRQLCCDLQLLMHVKTKASPEQLKLDEMIIDEDAEERVAEAEARTVDLDLEQLLKMSVLNDKFFDDREIAFLQNEDPFFGDLVNENVSVLERMECQVCLTCPIEPISSIVFTECHHVFCAKCMDQYLSHKESKNETAVCPMCRDQILAQARLLSPVIDSATNVVTSFQVERAPVLQDFVQSTKLYHLTKDLYELYDVDSSDRVIIFSQFSTFLDIIHSDLIDDKHEQRFEVSKFDGRLNLKERQTVLQQFDKDSTANKMKILLISLKAGGVGLNLTKANKAFLMDIWWNAGIEDQAIDRIHRIGQNRDVHIKRFIVKDSVEEKMLKIQERKRMLGAIVEGDAEERRQKRIEEIKSLFE